MQQVDHADAGSGFDQGLEPTGIEVEPRQISAAGADPEFAGFARSDRGDEAFGQARIIAEAQGELPDTGAVETVQAALGRDPDEALFVLGEVGHGLLQQIAGPGRGLEIEIALGSIGHPGEQAGQQGRGRHRSAVGAMRHGLGVDSQQPDSQGGEVGGLAILT